MTEQNPQKYLAEIDSRDLTPDEQQALEGKLSATGPTPDEAIISLRTFLQGTLEQKGVYVIEGKGFSADEKMLITDLRKKGIEDVPTRALLVEWTQSQEAAAETTGTPEARITFERRRAVLYWNAGFHEEADQAWEDALMIAQQEGKSDFSQAIIDEITAFRFD